MMRIFMICSIIALVGSTKLDYETSDDSDSGDEEPEYIPHVSTTLDFRGNVRKLFVVELGLASNGENAICSPITSMMSLAKLLIGTSKNSGSEKEILSALGLKRKNQLKSTYKQAIKDIEYLKGVEVSLASRIFISTKYRLSQKFKRRSASIFRSAIELVDMKKPTEVASTVNTWVSKNTNNAIRNIITHRDVQPDTSLFLVNAIYFNGHWETQFNPARQGSFYSPQGMINVQLMKISSGSFNYHQSDELNAQVLELPYKGEESAMIIVLPNAKNGLPVLLRTLKVSIELLNIALMKMKTAIVDVTIPKFKAESVLNLKSYYRKMGVSHSLAQETSGLKKIVKRHTIHISTAIQKAIIDVNEIGTVAGAGEVIAGYGSGMTIPIQFLADHPFMYYIRAHHEQLFGGVVNVPNY